MKYGVRNCKLKQTWPSWPGTDWHNNAQSSLAPGHWLPSVQHPVREEGAASHSRVESGEYIRPWDLERERMLELQLVTTVCSLASLTTGCVATNHHILSGSSSQQSPISCLPSPSLHVFYFVLIQNWLFDIWYLYLFVPDLYDWNSYWKFPQFLEMFLIKINKQ